MLSLSVAVYNLPDVTRGCFESLERTLAGADFEVLVYDNHSTDPAMAALWAGLDPARYKVVHGDANLGYRGAHRANARRFAGDWFVIINNDILFDEPRWDRQLVVEAGIGVVGVKGDVCNALAEDGTGYYDPRAVRAPMYVDGHFMAIPRAVLLEEGLFEDEQIGFCYFEDADHSLTLRQKGYRFGAVPIGLTHLRGSTVRSLSAEERLFLVQTFEHNRWRFLSKWAGEVRTMRAGLSWEGAETAGCAKRAAAAAPVARKIADLIQRGLADHQAGKTSSAEALYRRALSSGGQPAPAADNLLAVLLMDTARAAEALVHARRAVRSEPGNAFYLATLGNAEQAAGHVPDAFRTYLCARALNPADEYVLYNLGRLCLQNRMPEEAAAFYLEVIKAAPGMLAARYGLGRALADLGRSEDAMAVLGVVVQADPAHEDAALELTNLYIRGDRYAEAETVLRAAVRHLPGSHALHNNLGIVLHKMGDEAGAQAALQSAIAGDPDNAEYHSNYAVSLAAENRLPAAIAASRRAIAIAPDHADAHWNLALALLRAGEYPEGWREYRWGLRTRKPRATPREFERPAWDGSDPAGQRILIYAEQGYGDTFQLVRYAPMIHARGAQAIVECQPGLRTLIAGVPGVDLVVEQGEPLPPFDRHASVFDLPRLFATTLETIPSACGYLRADDGLVLQWRERLSGLVGMKVGLAWQGRAAHAHDHLRSIPLAALAPLLDVEGISFVSLQKGYGSEQIAASPFAGRIADLTGEWDAAAPGRFVDAAAVIAGLDLVITVDSAIAHLAGALGRPVWTLIQYAPDWRWLLEREDSPWYPSMRLFRQTDSGDWSGPIARAAAALDALARGAATRD